MLPNDRTHLSNICMGTMFYICPAVACKVRGGGHCRRCHVMLPLRRRLYAIC